MDLIQIGRLWLQCEAISIIVNAAINISIIIKILYPSHMLLLIKEQYFGKITHFLGNNKEFQMLQKYEVCYCLHVLHF